MEKFKIHRIHFTYAIAFLVIAIIGLMTVKWGRIPQLIEYITFALTLTSLTLSLLAIIYSLVSNSRLSESVGSLGEVTKDVLNSSSKLSEVTKALDEKVENIPLTLKSMEEKADKTHKLVEDIQKANNQKKEPERQSDSLPEQNTINVEHFVKYTSFVGKLLLYSCALSKNQNKGFSLEELFKENNINYVKGFLVACSSFEVVIYTETKGIYIVTDLDEKINSQIKNSIYETAESHDKDQEPEYLPKFSWIELIKHIEIYFNEKQ